MVSDEAAPAVASGYEAASTSVAGGEVCAAQAAVAGEAECVAALSCLRLGRATWGDAVADECTARDAVADECTARDAVAGARNVLTVSLMMAPSVRQCQSGTRGSCACERGCGKCCGVSSAALLLLTVVTIMLTEMSCCDADQF